MDYPGHRRIGMLGRGSFGEADLFTDEETGDLTVVKFLRNTQIDEQLEAYVLREIRNHQLLSGHPAIIQLKQVFLTPTHLGIAMEFATGGDLHARIVRAGRFTEDVARYFFQQLVQGLAWCHGKHVWHRDLKLENLLLDKPVPDEALWDFQKLVARGPQIKLCDFGCSKSGDLDSRPDTLVGTPAFTAPELFAAGKRGQCYSGEPVDVWACGVTLYFMLVGDMPFRDPEHNRVVPKLVYHASYTIPEGVEVSSSCQDLLARIFVPDPCQRITLAGIQRHPWFRKNLPRGAEPEVADWGRRLPRWLCCFQGPMPTPGPAPAPAPAAVAPSHFRQSEEEIQRLVKEARRRGEEAPTPELPPAGPQLSWETAPTLRADEALFTMTTTVGPAEP